MCIDISLDIVRSIWLFVPSSAPNLSSPYLVENHHHYKSRDERETFDENTRVNFEDAASLAATGRNKNGADWGTDREKRIVAGSHKPIWRVRSLDVSSVRTILSPFRPFATVSCKYERSFIRTESNSPNNVFLPPRPDARSARRWFPSVRECTAIPFLRAVDCRKRDAAGVDEERDAWESVREESPPTINVYGAAPSFFPFYVVS